jgi:hypothetical protein
MNITQLKTSLPFIIQSGLVPNIIGKHGIGKSSVIAQYAKDNGYTFHPFFLGQMSDMGDLLGLPEFDRDSSGKATAVNFIHPAKLPKQPRAILFFDELNRASKDLLQGIFQLALEGTLHDYTLPPESAIIMAMNPATDDYAVLDFADKAFGDRFVHINLDPTHEEFHSFMSSKYKTSSVSNFLRQQPKLLEESDLKPVSLDFVKPSRRSWDRLQLLENSGMPDDLFREAGMGIVGAAGMISYVSWRETQVKVVDGSEVLTSYESVREKYLSYFQNIESPRTDLVSSVCSSFSEAFIAALKSRKLSEKEAKNVAQFLIDTPVEYCYATILPLKRTKELALDPNVKKHVLLNDELVERVKEAKKAKKAYLEAQEAINKSKRDNDELFESVVIF